MVLEEGISMDPSTVQTILDWQTPTSVRDVQCFLGFVNFYRKFIKNYANIIIPLTQLTQMQMTFMWSANATEAFRNLK